MILRSTDGNPQGLFKALRAGWGDGSKTERCQYSYRENPAAKQSGYNYPETPIVHASTKEAIIAPETTTATAGTTEAKPKVAQPQGKPNGKKKH
jgi:hypothetical protein